MNAIPQERIGAHVYISCTILLGEGGGCWFLCALAISPKMYVPFVCGVTCGSFSTRESTEELLLLKP